jgi:hypothetical protein
MRRASALLLPVTGLGMAVLLAGIAVRPATATSR